MRTHPDHPALRLVELADLRADPLAEEVRASFDALTTVVHWAADYLGAAHPELGRAGPVCPFAAPSLRAGTFFLAVMRGDPDAAVVETAVRAYAAWLPELEPREGPLADYRSINLLLPDLPEEAWEERIEGVRDTVAAELMATGVKVGEFHPGPPSRAATWNPEFRARPCPVPLLSIRPLVPADWMLVRGRQDWASAYLQVHGGNVPQHLAADVAERAAAYGLVLPAPRILGAGTAAGAPLTPSGA